MRLIFFLMSMNKMGIVIPFQKIGLKIRARLENVTKLRADGDDFRWYLKVYISMCATFVSDL